MSEPTWELLGGGGALGGPIDYIGAWSAGVTYQPGQVVRYNGFDYLAVNVSTGATPPAPSVLVPPAYGTSLPASPYDGQEAILVDSLAGPSYTWRFRYNAGSSSAYKWEFVGGAAVVVGPQGATSGFTGGSTFVDLSSSPTFTIPRAGDYEVAWGGLQQANAFTAPYETWSRVRIGSNAPLVNAVFVASALYAGASVSGIAVLGGVSAGALTAVQIAASTATSSNFNSFWIRITPRRVA